MIVTFERHIDSVTYEIVLNTDNLAMLVCKRTIEGTAEASAITTNGHNIDLTPGEFEHVKKAMQGGNTVPQK